MYATIEATHCNFSQRCWYYGVKCNHAQHCDAEGCMTLAWLETNKPDVYKIVTEGPMTIVLSWRIRTEAPQLLRDLIRGGNVKNAAFDVEHSLNHTAVIASYCAENAHLAMDSLKQAVKSRWCGEVSKTVAANFSDFPTSPAGTQRV